MPDMNIFYQRIPLHKKRLQKHYDDKGIPDTFSGSDRWNCAILADKSYQSAYEIIRVITPHKKPIGGILSAEKKNSLTRNFYRIVLSLKIISGVYCDIISAKYK